MPRVPRAAAVAITALAEDEEEFSTRVSGAMAAIKVADLGITAMWPRRAVGDVMVGERRRDAAGLYSMWTRGPVAAATKLVKAGIIAVNSLVARVLPLA